MTKIIINIDNVDTFWDQKDSFIEINENQSIYIKIYIDLYEVEDINIMPRVYFEDLELQIEICENGDTLIYTTPKLRLFNSVFGNCILRVYYNNHEYKIPFDVKVSKLHAEHAKEMIAYIFDKSEEMIRLCLSRSTIFTGSKQDNYCDPESMISTAENFVRIINESKAALSHNIKKRLIPIRTDAWNAIQSSNGLEVNDVLENLDALIPVSSYGDIFLNGRHFDISNILATILHESPNVEENHVLIGGVYSIFKKISDLKLNIENSLLHENKIGILDKEQNKIFDNNEYQSLKKVLAQVTSASLLTRCSSVIENLGEVIEFFERKLHITYQGEILPKFTPFVRSSRLYHLLFSQLQLWYDLGVPTLDGLNFLIKLRSMSKIFEYVTLFKLIDFFISDNWDLNETEYDNESNFEIPVSISFLKHDESVTVKYEPKLRGFNPKTSHHQELVDLKNISTERYPSPYWKPDFVIRHNIRNNISYFILDAKYSCAQVVKKFSLPDIVEKYYLHTGVYDYNLKTINKNKIYAVLAIYPMFDSSSKNINFHRNSYLNSDIPEFPYLHGIPLAARNESNLFINSLTVILKKSRMQLSYKEL